MLARIKNIDTAIENPEELDAEVAARHESEAGPDQVDVSRTHTDSEGREIPPENPSNSTVDINAMNIEAQTGVEESENATVTLDTLYVNPEEEVCIGIQSSQQKTEQTIEERTEEESEERTEENPNEENVEVEANDEDFYPLIPADSPLRYLFYLPLLLNCLMEVMYALDSTHKEAEEHNLSAGLFRMIITALGAFIIELEVTGHAPVERMINTLAMIKRRSIPSSWPNATPETMICWPPINSPIREAVALTISLPITTSAAVIKGFAAYYFMNELPNQFPSILHLGNTKPWNIASQGYGACILASQLLQEGGEQYQHIRSYFAPGRSNYVHPCLVLLTSVPFALTAASYDAVEGTKITQDALGLEHISPAELTVIAVNAGLVMPVTMVFTRRIAFIVNNFLRHLIERDIDASLIVSFIATGGITAFVSYYFSFLMKYFLIESANDDINFNEEVSTYSAYATAFSYMLLNMEKIAEPIYDLTCPIVEPVVAKTKTTFYRVANYYGFFRTEPENTPLLAQPDQEAAVNEPLTINNADQAPDPEEDNEENSPNRCGIM